MKKPMPKFFVGDPVVTSSNTDILYLISERSFDSSVGWIYSGVAISQDSINFTSVTEDDLDHADTDQINRHTISFFDSHRKKIHEMTGTTNESWFGDPSFGLDGQRPKLLCDNPSYVNPLVDYMGDDLKSCWLTWIRDRR